MSGHLVEPVLASGHLLQRAVALEEHRLLYVPVPKAASTTMLWALAELAGIPPSEFERSTKLEVTRSLAVHDSSIWGSSFRLEGRSPTELAEILTSAGWFRFTVVRDPTRRLWSAWTSKLLAHHPRFVASFGDEDWFPPPPASSHDVVDSFRRFVHVLPLRERDWHDPHWSSQAELASAHDVPYALVGRTESLTETFGALAERGIVSTPRRENSSLLPFDPGLFDAATLEASDTVTGPDRDAFGYERPAPAGDGPGAAWHAAVEASLTAIRAVIERNERIGDLRRLLDDSVSRRRRLGRRAVRRS